VDGAEALASLGLQPGADWAEIKRAYRIQIRSHHPDLSDEPGGEAAAARIIAAYGFLAELAREGRLPQFEAEPVASNEPAAQAESAPNREQQPESAVLVVPPGALFDRLLEAAHEVGDVTYLDPEASIVALLVALPGWPPSQLTCQIARRGPDDVIISTLDSLDAHPAPPIETVVELLARQLRSR
jgi:hypothetical protein